MMLRVVGAVLAAFVGTTPAVLADGGIITPPCDISFCEACFVFCGLPPYTCTAKSSTQPGVISPCEVDPLCDVCEELCPSPEQIGDDEECPAHACRSDPNKQCPSDGTTTTDGGVVIPTVTSPTETGTTTTQKAVTSTGAGSAATTPGAGNMSTISTTFDYGITNPTEADTTTTQKAATSTGAGNTATTPGTGNTTTTSTTFHYQLCGLGRMLTIVEAVGRPNATNSTDEPNGDQEQPLVNIFNTTNNTQIDCPLETSNDGPSRKLTNEGTTTDTYDVVGGNLPQVSTDIFENKGPMVNGKRYAGQATLNYSYKYNYVFDPNKKILTVEITDVTWTTTILLPAWDFPPGLAQNEKDEWTRFLAALTTHETQHVTYYNEDMAKVKASVVGKTVTLNVDKLPEVDETTNEGKSEEDKEILKELGDAVEARIQGDAKFVDMLKRQDDYDAPNSVTNTIGTDHGKTEGAVLNTNP